MHGDQNLLHEDLNFVFSRNAMGNLTAVYEMLFITERTELFSFKDIFITFLSSELLLSVYCIYRTVLLLFFT